MNDKASVASYGASGIAAYIGMVDWNTVATVGGLFLAIATFGINWYYKSRDSRAFRDAILKGVLREPKN